jgi:hypothetical protein
MYPETMDAAKKKTPSGPPTQDQAAQNFGGAGRKPREKDGGQTCQAEAHEAKNNEKKAADRF